MKQDCVGGLMETAMENIKGMVEVNTIIGDAVETPGGTVIIPVSKMCCGFASGGTHMVWDKQDADGAQHPPFGGGAGAGVSVQPVGFLLVGDSGVGKSETAIRDCLAARYNREDFVLANKLSEWYFEKEEDVLPLFESQLKLCGVDYFDFYLFHCLNRKSYPKHKECNTFEIVKKGVKLVLPKTISSVWLEKANQVKTTV